MTPDGGGRNVFVHTSAIQTGAFLEEGEKIEYDQQQGSTDRDIVYSHLRLFKPYCKRMNEMSTWLVAHSI